MPPAHTPHDFFAFISYKRGEKDEYYARWLQKKLESYRIPTEIAQDHEQALPKRLKVFRDKSDLGSHANLQDGLTKSLGQSYFLIVICSPRSAESPYVDAEVQYFQKQGRAQYIIPFIIDGTPAPKEGERQCYPPSLTAEVLGITLAEGTKEEALIKTVARLLQVDFPKLYQRHLRAQRRFMLRVATGLACVLALMAGLAAWALHAEQRATAQRKEAEELVEFMTFDLRDEAFDYIPLKARQKIMDKVEQYYKKWGVTSEAFLYTQAAHISNQAKNAFEKGDLDEASALYHQALTRIMALLKRNPNIPGLLHDAATGYAALGVLSQWQGHETEATALYEESRKYLDQTQSLPTQTDDGALTEYKKYARLCDATVTPDKAIRREYCHRAADLTQQLYIQDPQNFRLGDVFLHSQYTALMAEFGTVHFDLQLLEKLKDFSLMQAHKDPDNNTRQLFAGSYEHLWASFMILTSQEDSDALRQHLNNARARIHSAVQKYPKNALFQRMSINADGLEQMVLVFIKGKAQLATLHEKVLEARAMAEKHPQNMDMTLGYAHALDVYAALLCENAQFAEAKTCAIEHIAYLEQLLLSHDMPAVRYALANACANLGSAEYGLQNYTTARAALDSSLALLEQLPQQYTLAQGFDGIAAVLNKIQKISMAQGDYATAARVSQRSLDLVRQNYQRNTTELGAAVSYVVYAQDAAILAQLVGQEDKAHSILSEILPLAQDRVANPSPLLRGRERATLAGILTALGALESTAGNSDIALRLLQQAIQHLDAKYYTGNDQGGILEVRMIAYWIFVQYALNINDVQKAAEYATLLQQVAQIDSKENKRIPCAAYGVAISGFMAAQQFDKAESLATMVRPQAHAELISNKDFIQHMSIAYYYIADAQLLLATQRFDEAEQTLVQIEPVLQLLLERCPANVNAKQYLAELYIVRGDIARHKGDMPKAQEAYTNSYKELDALLRMVPGHVRWKKLLATAQGSLEKSR